MFHLFQMFTNYESTIQNANTVVNGKQEEQKL